ncbi:MAG: DUF3467 domain-containing protein [Thermoguttaceae bacterium]
MSDSPSISPEQQPNPSQQQVVRIDDSKVLPSYANFCRVTGMPEEVIIDFALNPQPIGLPDSIPITERVVMNFFTAKRLLFALGATVERHEQTFGILEMDLNKRVKRTEKSENSEI